MSYQLGVDLGTTFTAAAVANGMPATMVGLGNRALQIPSVVFLAEDDTVLVGEAAERRGLTQPGRVVREFKRRIGDTVPILVAGSPFSAQALTARMLQHVVETATQRLNERPATVVLTHPANWGPYKLDLLDQAARLAGVDHATRCPEPLAAAAQYAAQRRVAVGDTVAVYDLGGGTFDACVLQKTSSGFTLLGTPEGIEHLGGIDFDDALFQHVLSVLGDRLSDIDPDDPEAVRGLARLRRDCVDAKEALSTDTYTMLPVALPGLSTTLRLNRTEFEGLIRPALADTMSALDRTVRSANHSPDQLRAIVLVGGSSRIPLIGELLHHSFASTPIAIDTHPKHDIALGAVQTDHAQLHGAVPEPAPRPTPRPDQPPTDRPTINPTTTITIGSKASAPTTLSPATAPTPAPIPQTTASSAQVQQPPGTTDHRQRLVSKGSSDVKRANSISFAGWRTGPRWIFIATAVAVFSVATLVFVMVNFNPDEVLVGPTVPVTPSPSKAAASPSTSTSPSTAPQSQPTDSRLTGLLQTDDLPPIGPGGATWEAVTPSEPPVDFRGSGCETVKWAKVKSMSTTHVTYLPTPLGGGYVGLDEILIVMASEKEAEKLASKVKSDWNSCSERWLTADVSKIDKLPATAETTTINGWTTEVTQASSSGSSRYRVGVATTENKVVFLYMNPNRELDWSDSQFERVTTQAGRRAHEVI